MKILDFLKLAFFVLFMLSCNKELTENLAKQNEIQRFRHNPEEVHFVLIFSKFDSSIHSTEELVKNLNLRHYTGIYSELITSLEPGCTSPIKLSQGMPDTLIMGKVRQVQAIFEKETLDRLRTKRYIYHEKMMLKVEEFEDESFARNFVTLLINQDYLCPDDEVYFISSSNYYPRLFQKSLKEYQFFYKTLP